VKYEVWRSDTRELGTVASAKTAGFVWQFVDRLAAWALAPVIEKCIRGSCPESPPVTAISIQPLKLNVNQ